MLKTAICDDNPEHLNHAASLVLAELSSYAPDVELFHSAEDLIQAVECDRYRPDIAILDILLEDENGIELAKKLNALLPGCSIIFLTGYPDYAPASYEARHVWFVLKSSAEQYLGPALHRALDAAARDESILGITAHSRGKRFFLPLGDILYIERVARKTRIVCKDASYYVSGSPAAQLQGAVSSYFLRCHQGYWVNTRQIKALQREEFVLTDGTRIPISRTFRDEARSRFFEQFSALQ